MSTLLKLYQSILNSRLVSYLETIGFFHDEQSGFIMDCHFLLKELLNSRQDRVGPCGGRSTAPTLLAFLDLRKAFDKVPRSILWSKLSAAGVPTKFLNILKDQFSNISGKVRLDHLITKDFEIQSGVVQGSRCK